MFLFTWPQTIVKVRYGFYKIYEIRDLALGRFHCIYTLFIINYFEPCTYRCQKRAFDMFLITAQCSSTLLHIASMDAFEFFLTLFGPLICIDLCREKSRSDTNKCLYTDITNEEQMTTYIKLWPYTKAESHMLCELHHNIHRKI